MGSDQDRSQAQLLEAEAAGAFPIWLLVSAYSLVMLVFLWRTYREGEVAGGGRWDAPRLGGLLLSAAWPLLILIVGATVLLRRRQADAGEAGPDVREATSPAPQRHHVVLFGIPIVDQSFESAVAQTAALARSDERSTIYFVNAHTLNLASQSPTYTAVLRKADIVFGDGTGVRWAARMRGRELSANLNGTDLVPAVLQCPKGFRCFIVGSTPERIGRIGESFASRFPNVELVGCHHGYIDEAASLAVVREINEAEPDVLLVGMGNPLQEEWIHRHRGELQVPLAMAVGGLLEYWSGMLVRAPGWMRRSGIEWLHILRHQPWKARRYLIGNFAFVWRSLMWLAVDLRKRKASA